MDLNKASKVIAEEMGVAYNPTTFLIGFRHGSSVDAYALDPAGAKAFAQNLTQRVAEYEKEVGSIDMSRRGSESASPMQPRA